MSLSSHSVGGGPRTPFGRAFAANGHRLPGGHRYANQRRGRYGYPYRSDHSSGGDYGYRGGMMGGYGPRGGYGSGMMCGYGPGPGMMGW